MIFLVEAFPKSSFSDSIFTSFSLPGYSLIHTLPDPGNRGILVFSRFGLSCSPLKYPFSENLGLRVSCPLPLDLLVFYRSPSSRVENDSALAVHLRSFFSGPVDAFAFGDLNGPRIDWNDFSGPSNFSSLFSSLHEASVSQVISGPTRFRDGQNPSSLDVAFLKNPPFCSLIESFPLLV